MAGAPRATIALLSPHHPMTALPLPSPDAQAASAALCRLIAAEIDAAGGWLSFARFMERALYAPGLGYYAGGAHKFGAAGDFVTAPELSPLFAQTLAAQAAQVMALSAPHIVEVGAGSGQLAADLLLELEARAALPESYAILDLSGELRARQQATLTERAPHLARARRRAPARAGQRTARRVPLADPHVAAAGAGDAAQDRRQLSIALRR